MALCPKCGSQVADDAKFCGSCGATITPSGGAPGVTPTPPPSPGPASSGAQGGMAPNVAALLVYVPVCFVGVVCAILFGFLLDPYKKDRFIRFHAWQSLAIHVCLVGFWIAWWFIVMILAFITHGLAILLFPVNGLLGVGALVLMVFLMIKANGMQTYKVPVIGDWAEKQANS